jgi:hypothetical protein
LSLVLNYIYGFDMVLAMVLVLVKALLRLCAVCVGCIGIGIDTI